MRVRVDFPGAALFADLADLWRRERASGLRSLIEVADFPLLRRGLEMVCADAGHDELCATLEAQQEEELRQVERRHGMVAAGIGAAWDLKSPEETAEIVRQAAG